ncbi:hypothetical protein [Legionella cincinnatiensis]|uniref:hypothetical protein n=1 Tax=Legionella cincinnatiensis TaxID=28085 RepID=UPI00104184AE|nr:hypothetical protein [Legionella cincinnatiensis]
MPKSKYATPAYNALFQEYASPLVKFNRDMETVPRDDTGQSCHVFALISSPFWEARNELNTEFANVGTKKLQERMHAWDLHEINEEKKKRLNEKYEVQPFPSLTEKEIREERMFNMGEILKLEQQRLYCLWRICSFAEVFDMIIWYLNICGSKTIQTRDPMTHSLIVTVSPL